MVWVKYDDNFNRCNKVLYVGRDARDLFMAAVFHCNRELTDGFVGEHLLSSLAVDAGIKPASRKYIQDCVEKLLETAPQEKSPLWHKVPGGYMIHDYLDYQPTRKDVLETRDKLAKIRSEAGRKGAQKRWGKGKGDDDDIANDGKTDGKRDGKHSKSDGKFIAPLPESRIGEDSIGESVNVYVDSSSAREGSTETGSGGLINFPWAKEKYDAIERVAAMNRDKKSWKAYAEEYDACLKNNSMDIWELAEEATRIKILSDTLVGTPGSYFYGIVKNKLFEKGVFLSGSKEDRAEVGAQLDEIRSFLRGDSDAPDGDERPP